MCVCGVCERERERGGGQSACVTKTQRVCVREVGDDCLRCELPIAAFRGFCYLSYLQRAAESKEEMVAHERAYRSCHPTMLAVIEPYMLATTCVIHAIPWRCIGRATISLTT